MDNLTEALQSKLPPMLYHYTGCDAFASIVGHKDGVRFLCTNYRFLNDRAEFSDGIEFALDWLCPQRDVECGEMVRKSLEDIRSSEGWLSTPWIASFCAKRDSTELWMTYTDRSSGGFSIGIDSQLAMKGVKWADEIIKKHSGNAEADKSLSSIGGMFLAPCIYYNRKTRKGIDLFQEALKYVFSDRELFYCLLKNNPRMYAAHCARQVVKVASLLKRDDYKFEKEWRVVFVPMREDRELFSGICLVGGKPRISLKTTFKQSSGIVKEVWVAPHGDPASNKMVASVLNLARHNNYRICTSESSYNGR